MDHVNLQAVRASIRRQASLRKARKHITSLNRVSHDIVPRARLRILQNIQDQRQDGEVGRVHDEPV